MTDQGTFTSIMPSTVTSNLEHTNKSGGSKPVKCRLCKEPPVQLTHLNCKHTFCYMCLQTYVESKHYTDSLSFPCPHCGKLSAPPWGIWHLCHKVVDRSHDELYQTWKYEAMCDNCACDGLYATAGRHCSDCNIHLCDTCAFAHSVMADTQTHSITTQMSKTGNTGAVLGEGKEIKTGKYVSGGKVISSR